jgi:hypothetical protein
MSTVTAEEIAVVLSEARAKQIALAEELAVVTEALVAEASPATFKAYYVKHAEFGRHDLRLSLVKKWAADLGVEVMA